jgi:hypothetical protein
VTSRKSSELGYYARGLASRLKGNAALDVSASRMGVLNNLNLLQDEMGQHGASMCMPTSPGFGTAYWTQATTTPGTYSRLDGLPPKFTFLRMQSDGSSSRVQVTVTAYSSSAGTAIRLRAFLGAHVAGRLPTLMPADPTTTTVTADQSTTSGTAVTLHFTALYSSRLSDAWLLNYPSTDGTGAASGVQFYGGSVEVWATSDNAAVHPRVTSISVREYVG